MEPVFTNWTDQHTGGWGNRPVLAEHNLHLNPLFSRQALAELIQIYPVEHYSLVHTNQKGESRRVWREGEIGDLNGHEVIDWIAAGRMWLNLRNVKMVDRRYGTLLDGIFEELATRVPGFDTFNRGMGILISSPNASVHYHADLPGQSLWQIMGSKRLYLYPNEERFLPQAALERIALYGIEETDNYRPDFDAEAMIVDLQPGQMMTWPLNAPHRVENHDCLNVSVTTEHWTDEIRRQQMVSMGNGVLRNVLGITPKSRAISGPGFLAKAALQAAWRRSPWLKRQRSARRPIDFRLGRAAPGMIVDIPQYTR